MTLRFEHVTLGQRVLFGTGEAAENLAKEVERLQATAIMLISGGSELEFARIVTNGVAVTTEYTNVVQHVPVEIAQDAIRVAQQNQIDLLVCVGGGSTTGLAKAVALELKIPIVAVPTTYSGSEATNVWGLTEAARKTTGVDDAVLPVAVIYDADLTMSLPVELSVASGLNGMAHCIDSMWGPRADPINQALAIEGISALSQGLERISQTKTDVEGREKLFYGAYLAAVAFSSAGSGMHHKICHVLGGTFNLPHAQTHATVLPYVLAFNMSAAPTAAARIAKAFNSADALQGLQDLRTKLGAPRKLSDYGFTEAGIPEAVEVVLPAIPKNNPRPVTARDLTQLLQAALNGDDPEVLK